MRCVRRSGEVDADDVDVLIQVGTNLPGVSGG
jgi:hypothetical protein